MTTASGALPLPRQQHAHLRLREAVTPGRRQGGRGFAGTPRYDDRAQHARTIRTRAIRVIDSSRRRPQVLGIDPELVVVLETNRRLELVEVERAGLQVLEIRGTSTLVAFSADEEMRLFLDQTDQYAQGPRGYTEKGNERAALHQALFDALEDIRQLTSEDVLSKRVVKAMSQANGDDRLRIDIQCWCPEGPNEADRRQREVRQAVENAGGLVLASSLRAEAGLSVLCVEAPAASIIQLARTDRVRLIDDLPQPALTYPHYFGARREDLPVVGTPPASAPIVGIVDSGIRSAHPFLAPAVLGVEYVGASLGDGGDEHGHGTLVASLALYGSLESCLTPPGQSVRPVGRLVSVRVLNHDNQFPSDRAWEEHLLEAMQIAVDSGARVLNLSLGDARRPYSPPRPTVLATLVDQFARANDVVVVISAGNYKDIEYEVEALIAGDFPKNLLESANSGLVDPASAALALTVGALCGETQQGVDQPADANLLPVGGEGMPSPYTRVGPGVARMVKPELCAPGGSLSVDTLMKRAATNDRRMQVVGAGGESYERLLAAASGTSFAAPLVTHAALRVLARYPQMTANGVRALLLASVTEVDLIIEGAGPAKNREAQRRLTGYGRIDTERAEASDDHRVVLVSEARIAVDNVHMYSVPLPSSFFASGGTSTISISLAYDPPVRATRLEYLASRMSIFAFHGVSHEKVRSAFIKSPPAESLTADGDIEDVVPPELQRFKLALQPADATRGRGANHFGKFIRKQRFDAARGRELVVAVRSTNKWDSPEAVQPYALVVVLERDDRHPALYAELRVQLEAMVELQIEL